MPFIGIFNFVNIARFARNVEWDFFCDFQTPWSSISSWPLEPLKLCWGSREKCGVELRESSAEEKAAHYIWALKSTIEALERPISLLVGPWHNEHLERSLEVSSLLSLLVFVSCAKLPITLWTDVSYIQTWEIRFPLHFQFLNYRLSQHVWNSLNAMLWCLKGYERSELLFRKNVFCSMKLLFEPFLWTAKMKMEFLSNLSPISNNLLNKLLHKTIGGKLLKNSIFNFAVDKKGWKSNFMEQNTFLRKSSSLRS